MAIEASEISYGFSVQNWDLQHFKQTEAYVSAIDKIYSQAIADFARLATRTKVDPSKPFSFKDYPAAKKEATRIINELSSKAKTVIETGSREQWLFACKKNDAFLESILNTSKISKKALEKMQDRNLTALKAFQNRKVRGMDLSKRIWRYSEQFKQTMELGIDVGLGEGRSAQELSRDLRKNLLEPDKLFRRVRDKRGQLQLSKAAKAYNPGRGVYRSSYKNAMRLTRSEVNMAYKESDHERYDQLDFVVGFEVKLSNNHTINGVPFVDICDTLAGKYPKTFKFVGWHPQCRCYVVPILMDMDEFEKDEFRELKAALNGTQYRKYTSRNKVAGVPSNFTKWANKNQIKVDGYKSTPYFIRDNFKYGKIRNGLKTGISKKVVKTTAQKEAIQRAWNARLANRKYSDELRSIGNQYLSVPSVSDFIKGVEAEIKAGKPIKDIDLLVGKLKHKVEVKNAWDIRVEENRLGKLLVDVKGLKAKYNSKEIRDLYNAIEQKLASWEGNTLLQQKNKLLFEIKWVENTKKYKTWKAAQDAYKKRLDTVNYLIDKEIIEASLKTSFEYATSTKSSLVKKLSAELEVLLKKDAPVSTLKAKATELNAKVDQLIRAKSTKQAKKNAAKLSIDESRYSRTRKDKAVWAQTSESADAKFRPNTGSLWEKASTGEKQAAYEYTVGSGGYNRPLRGYERSWNGTVEFKGVGKADLNYEGRGQYIQDLTQFIDKSSYDFDVWLQRGVESDGAAKFLGLDPARLYNMAETDLKSLVGKIVNEPAFTSCGSAKGKGFSGHIFNIYCPSGTKMVYAEPFSHYGGSYGDLWDGISKSSLGSELETIIQKDTTFRITKVEKSGNRFYIDMEVVDQ